MVVTTWKTAADLYNISNAGLRFFNVYGPRQDAFSPYAGVVSIFNKLISKGVSITIYGDGYEVRGFVYVSDVANALILTMYYLNNSVNPVAEIFNVATGKGTTVKNLAASLEGIYGAQVEHVFMKERLGNVRKSIGDTDKICELCGYKSVVTLQQGLKFLKTHFRKQKNE